MALVKRILKGAGLVLLVLALTATGLYVTAHVASERAMSKRYQIEDADLPKAGSEAARKRGEYLARTRGCTDCHGEALEGRLVFDAGPVGRYVASNLTKGEGGVGAYYARHDWDRAIRHAVGMDGLPLIFMPSADWAQMSDRDAADLIAYVESVPAVDNDPGQTWPGPLARVLWLFGQFPLLPAEVLDHGPRERKAPQRAASKAYGEYVAHACTGCHGSALAGQAIPGVPPGTPRASDLRRSGAMAGWTEQDFLRLMREGKRPDGSEMHPMMPWQTFARMDDEELRALWIYLWALEG